MAKIKIKLVRSKIGKTQKQKRTIEALGFKKVGQIIEKEDTPQIRGMIQKVSHMVEVIE
ncbi:50S ribosomal protein L30 [Caloranaerobacter azorensis]|uniref:Large ribosomal subunit protein uL30 n=3 Tax=Caloranaerobacter azorensis TaxID=116090 RepID=A0A1M5TYT0_9FIRM|nr:50S ribosomal protein L30 [Caloranaerobacter azorensis]KGG81020.1 50S ribosomal protein L30 [Caloranaerobacter azorensis H53214]QIB27127.1 50S ribosomal protein L30 [Caloranaerobacter azorensis]SHH55899.1 LSU ribosomal protein L30P [Caloranaerobacter azorensis DSM 13643]